MGFEFCRFGQVRSSRHQLMQLVAELISDVDREVLGGLPEVQRIAMDRVLLRADGGGPASDHRVVATTFLSKFRTPGGRVPRAGRHRRRAVGGRVEQACHRVRRSSPRPTGRCTRQRGLRPRRQRNDGFLAATGQTERCRANAAGAVESWCAARVGVQRIGSLASPPDTVRIAAISHGNPFYALELGTCSPLQSPTVEAVLPAPLAELIRDRIGRLDGEVRDVLLAAACVPDPTVDLLAQVTGATAARLSNCSNRSKTRASVGIHGNRVRFNHPLLAQGLRRRQSGAAPQNASGASRHRVAARTEGQASRTGDSRLGPRNAADPRHRCGCGEYSRRSGCRRRARRPGDRARRRIPRRRRIRAAAHHFRAGNAEPGRAVIEAMVGQLPPGPLRATAANLLAEVRMYDNSFVGRC